MRVEKNVPCGDVLSKTRKQFFEKDWKRKEKNMKEKTEKEREIDLSNNYY